MKRTPLRRSTPLRARRPERRRSSRVYDSPWMALVRRLPCAARHLGRCQGRVEADHQGARGLGQKCSDRETVPMCSLHHREREAFAGAFRDFDKEQMRAWKEARIRETRDQVWSLMRRASDQCP